MQCVILAGGFGTRMLPLTSNIPKALLDVNGHPFIYYQLNWLSKYNITDILVCIGHKGNLIKDFVSNKFNNLNIDYVDEGENLLGTAGALRLAYDQNKLDSSFLLIYGDSFLPINFKDVFDYQQNHNYPALMTVFKNNNQFDRSNVLIMNNNILYDKEYKINTQDKYTHIDYGLSVLTTNVIQNIPTKQKSKLSDIFYELSVNNNLYGYEVYNRFYEIGSISGLNDLKEYFIENNHS